MLAPFERALAKVHQEGRKANKILWMLRVRSSRNSLVRAYKQLTVASRDPIDYSLPSVQAAYLYAYAMPRAYFASEMLRRHRSAIGKPLFPRGEIEVISFGGGPASELVGLIDYLEDTGNGESVTAISYRVFDKDGEWSSTAEEVISGLTCSIEVSTAYEQLDFADRAKCATVDVSDADLIMFSYSGIRNIPLPWTDLLRELKRRIEDCTDEEFNSVLLNYYRDNNDSMPETSCARTAVTHSR